MFQYEPEKHLRNTNRQTRSRASLCERQYRRKSRYGTLALEGSVDASGVRATSLLLHRASLRLLLRRSFAPVSAASAIISHIRHQTATGVSHINVQTMVNTPAQAADGRPARTVRWARWIARRPRTVFAISLSIHLAFVVITAILWVAGYNILPIVFDGLPLYSNGETMFLRSEAWRHRDQLVDSEVNRAKRDTRGLREANNFEFRFPATEPTLRMDVNHIPTFVQNLEQVECLLHTSLFGAPSDMAGTLDEDQRDYGVLNNIDVCCEPRDLVKTRLPRSCRCDHNTSPSPVQKQARKRRAADDEKHTKEREYLLSSLTILYEDKRGGNVITKENLKKIAKFEFQIYNMKDYQSKFCRLVSIQKMRSCQQFLSILRFFDGTFTFAHNDLFDPSFVNVSRVLTLASTHPDTEDTFKYFLARDAEVNMEKGVVRSSQTRSIIPFGYPLKEFGNNTDRHQHQIQILVDWEFEELVPWLTEKYHGGVDGLHFHFFAFHIYWEVALRYVFVDWYLLIGGICFIFLFMWFQIGSLFITFFGLFSIFTSFVGANLIYNCIIGYKFFGIFHVLAIFILLGIGADDIFIYSDTWKLHLREDYDTLEERLSSAFKRSAIAMFVTSLTTMVAFFVSSFSSVLVVASFGTFSGLTIAVNYISVVTYFPAVVTTYHLYFEDKACCCCGTRQMDREGQPRIDTNGASADGKAVPISMHAGLNTPSSTGSKTSTAGCSNRLNKNICDFFEGSFYRFVSHKATCVVILVIYLVLLGAAIYLCTTITMAAENLALFDKDNMYEVARQKNNKAFQSNSGEPTAEIIMSWGLDHQDRSECSTMEYNRLDPCEGKTIWDLKFDLTNPNTQMGLLGFCKQLRYLKGERREALQIGYNPVTGENNVTCFMEDMAIFYQNETAQPWYPAGLTFELPLTLEKVQNLMIYNPSIYKNGSHLHIQHPFEIALDFWLSHRYTNDSLPDKRAKFKKYLGFREVGLDNLAPLIKTSFLKEQPKIYENHLMYAGIAVNTDISIATVNLGPGVKYMDNWELFISEEMQQLPEPLRRGFQFCDLWHWFKMIQMSEASNLCLIVGLAVDYIVHFAEAYHMSKYSKRQDRVRDTLGKVGISVLSGAFTTLGATFFMMFANVLFFKQFGAFIFCTIGFSLIFTLFVFMSVYSLVGPENYTGSLLKCCKGRRQYETQADVNGTVNQSYVEESTSI